MNEVFPLTVPDKARPQEGPPSKEVARQRDRDERYAFSIRAGGVVRVSASKLRILQSLRGRPKTTSELAREFGIDRAAVHRHVSALHKSGLIERVDTGRKWVYYSLRPQGQRVADVLGKSDGEEAGR